MHIQIILKKMRETQYLRSTYREGNIVYLVKGEDNPDFPYLSEVEQNDYSTWDATDMDGIIAELQRVRLELSDEEDRLHIDEIIRLAERCKNTPGTVLVFAG